MNKLRNIVLTFATILPMLQIGAQESAATAGGTASSSSGSVSYTVGQVVYTTNSSTGGTVSQGIQYPYTISVVTELPEGEGIELKLTIYPNPVKDFLILEVPETALKQLSYYLIDGQGGVVSNQDISEVKTTISMLNIASGTYYLKVISSKNSQETNIKTFKIIKIQ